MLPSGFPMKFVTFVSFVSLVSLVSVVSLSCLVRKKGEWSSIQAYLSPISEMVCWLCTLVLWTLGIVQMHLTVPHQQKGPALSCWAQRSISLPLATDPSLHSGWHCVTVQTVKDYSLQLNLALIKLKGISERPLRADNGFYVCNLDIRWGTGGR